MTYYSGQVDLEYYPSGVIKSYVAMGSDEFLINGIYLKAAERTQITFYPGGQIKSLFLADDTKILVGQLSKKFHENDRVEFLEDGSLKLDSSVLQKTEEKVHKKMFFGAALKFFGI